MSQPCSQIELVLIDLESLRDVRVQRILDLAITFGVHRGGFIRKHVVTEPPGDVVDFWVHEHTETNAFERVMTLTGITPERTMFVSTDTDVVSDARNVGLTIADLDDETIERVFV